MQRRELLKKSIVAGTTVSISGLAGCLGGDDGDGESLGTLRVNTPTPEGTAIPNFMDEVATLVDEKSDGEITVDVFYGGELGAPIETFEQIQEGSIGGYATGWSVASNFYERFATFTTPYGFDNYEDQLEVLHSDRADVVQEEVETGAEETSLRAVEGGAAMLGAREPIGPRELTEPDQYSGLTIRSPESKFFQTVLGPDGLGADPIQIQPGEIGQALETGRVDVIEIPLEFTFAAGYHELREFVHNGHHLYNDAPLWVNEDRWQSAPEDEKEIIRESLGEAQPTQLANLKEREANIIDQLKDRDGSTYLGDDAINHERFAENVVGALDEAFSFHADLRSELLPDGGPWGV